MDRDRLLEKLDMDSPEDYKYYENFEALIEEEEHIEEELIREIFSPADPDLVSEHIDNFFESFMSNIPEDETELSMIAEIFRNNINSAMSGGKSEDAVADLISEIYKFRKWYSLDLNAVNKASGEELSIRDARYELLIAKLMGDDVSMDFGRAITSGPDAYEVKIRDII